MQTATATNFHHQQARRAIEGTMLSMIDENRASRVVSAPNKRQVWLTADIIFWDEVVLLRWRTTNGIEAARELRLAIDANLPALLEALVNSEVNA